MTEAMVLWCVCYALVATCVVLWTELRAQRRLVAALKDANAEKDAVIVALMKARVHERQQSSAADLRFLPANVTADARRLERVS